MELRRVIVTTLLILTPTFAHQLRSKKTVNNNFQDSLEVFREQQNDEIERNLICDELCPNPGSYWYVQKNQWKTEECPDDLKHCTNTFQGVSDKNPMKLIAKTMAWFKEENVVSWWVKEKVLAYCGSTYYVTSMEDDFDRHFKVRISNTTISRARCCGVRISNGYDGSKDC